MTNPDPDTIRGAWERYHGPPNDYGDPIPQSPPAYDRGYRDGWAAMSGELELFRKALRRCEEWRERYLSEPVTDESHADEVVAILKTQIQLLRIELADALMMGYGARMSWPESAQNLLRKE